MNLFEICNVFPAVWVMESHGFFVKKVMESHGILIMSCVWCRYWDIYHCIL